MTFITTLFVITTLMACWVLWVRPALRDKPWAKPFFDFIEPLEIALWSKSETILWARFKQVMALFVGMLGIIGEIPDPTPVIMAFPEKWRPFLLAVPAGALWLDNTIGVALRKRTTKPLEVVAAPADSPATAAANAVVEQANAQAVATVEAAKAA